MAWLSIKTHPDMLNMQTVDDSSVKVCEGRDVYGQIGSRNTVTWVAVKRACNDILNDVMKRI